MHISPLYNITYIPLYYIIILLNFLFKKKNINLLITCFIYYNLSVKLYK